MNKRTVKHHINGIDVYLDPNSQAYQLYKENKLSDLDKHLETLMRKGK